MKTKQSEINKTIKRTLAEAKKKKEKALELKHDTKPTGYGYSESFDFSAPLGAYNLYKGQGAVNWGPMTGPGTKVDDRIAGQRADIQTLTRDMVKEAAAPSAWANLTEEKEVDEASATWNALKKGVGSFFGGAKNVAKDAAKAVGGAAKDAVKGTGSAMKNAAKDASAEFSATASKNKAEKEKQAKEKQAAKASKSAGSSKTSVAKNARDYFQKTTQMSDTLGKSKNAVSGDEELLASLENAISSLEDTTDSLGNVARVADSEDGEEGRLALVAK